MPTDESGKTRPTRIAAERRLKSGTAPPSTVGAAGPDALELLYRLASAAEGAGDALKLLHELQVHQVELDLQHEQMEAGWRELAHDLARYKGLYDFAPAGYFNVSPEGNIIEGNHCGGDLFGVRRDALAGRRIDSFLAPASRPALLELLRRVRSGGVRETCAVQSGGDEGVSRRLQAAARVLPGGPVLLVFVEVADLRTADSGT